MSRNWDITKTFSPSHLALFVIVTLAIGSWFVWAHTADPEPVTKEFNIDLKPGSLTLFKADLRKGAIVKIEVNHLPQNPIELVITPVSHLSSIYYDENITVTDITYDIQSTTTWEVTLNSYSSSVEPLSLKTTYDNPVYAKTDTYLIVAVFLMLIFFANVVIHWKQFHYLKLWIIAKRRHHGLVLNQEVDMAFGHEDLMADANGKDQDDKLSSVFGNKKKT